MEIISDHSRDFYLTVEDRIGNSRTDEKLNKRKCGGSYKKVQMRHKSLGITYFILVSSDCMVRCHFHLTKHSQLKTMSLTSSKLATEERHRTKPCVRLECSILRVYKIERKIHYGLQFD